MSNNNNANTPDASTGKAADEFLTAEEVAARLKIGRETLRHHMRDGKIPFIRLGQRKLQFFWPDVLESVRRQTRGAV